MKKRKIFNIIFLSLLTITIIIIISSGTAIIFFEHRYYIKEKKHIKEMSISEKKRIIKTEVNKVTEYIAFKRGKLHQNLKKSLRRRLYEAHAIAEHLYSVNKSSKTKKEIENLVREALRPIRFNNGRGYYFAFNLNGIGELFADHPELEGKNMLSMRDIKGKYVLKDMIKLIKKNQEGFYKHYWTKPKYKKKEFPKISFIKYVDSLKWIIGTGEYLDDFEEDLKKEVLERIAKIRFGSNRNGYIFVVSYSGTTLMNDTQRHLIGKNIWNLTDPDGKKVIREERKAVKNPAGDFISYKWNKPSSKEIANKISFVKGIKEWRWMVGAGVYKDDYNKMLLKSNELVKSEFKEKLITLILIMFFAAIGIIIISYFFTQRLKLQFKVFADFFKNAAIENHTINIENIYYEELKQLAESANRMINERYKIEKDLIKAKDKAEMASSAKTNFFAVMSHEIRTPLNAIIGMTDIILDSKLTKDQKEYLSTVKDSSYHLLNIINDVLNFSKIESKQLTLKHEEFNLQKLLNSTIKLFSAPAKEKSLSLKINKTKNYGIIKSDPILIKQILINLIGNAIKFTNKGSIILNISHEGLIKKKSIFNLIIAIEDTGVGIKKKDIQKIFKSFEQLDNSFSRKIGGTGLGLAISKKLCTLLKGKISVETEYGKGSKFIITLPVKYISSKDKNLGKNKSDISISNKKLKILLVEDNIINAKMVSLALKKNNHIITHAESGEKAIALIKKNRYDCILMDIEMPGMSGIDAVKIIRKGEAGKKNINIPILAVTAHVLDDLVEKYKKIGFDEFLSKPIKIHSFNNIIIETINKKTG